MPSLSSSSSIRVVLVQPLFSSNVGLCCRVMKNFGFSELVIVQPASGPNSGAKADNAESKPLVAADSNRAKKTKTAFMYAKHSKEVLHNARVVPTLDAAVSDCQFVVGTTGAPKRFHRQLKPVIPLSKLGAKLKGKVALVFGSEGVGLNAEQTNACDVLVHVPANPEHPVLNLSHAVAVVLYAVSTISWEPESNVATLGQRRMVVQKFDRLISGLERVKDKKKVGLAFRRILGRSEASADELQAFMAALAALEKRR